MTILVVSGTGTEAGRLAREEFLAAARAGLGPEFGRNFREIQG